MTPKMRRWYNRGRDRPAVAEHDAQDRLRSRPGVGDGDVLDVAEVAETKRLESDAVAFVELDIEPLERLRGHSAELVGAAVQLLLLFEKDLRGFLGGGRGNGSAEQGQEQPQHAGGDDAPRPDDAKGAELARPFQAPDAVGDEEDVEEKRRRGRALG